MRYRSLQPDDSAAILQRLLGGFEQADDAEAGLAVVGRGPAFENAIHEISKLEGQRFRRVDIRRPDVSGAVADQQVIDALTICDLDASVVTLDLLIGLEIVP